MSELFSNNFSSFATALDVAKIEEFCGNCMFTSNSGRSEDGKNWWDTNFIPIIDEINNAIVMEIVFLGERIAATKTTRKTCSSLLSFC